MDIEINTLSLKSDVGKMSEKVNSLRNTMKQMNDAILEMNGMWDGISHDAFVTQYSTDYENMMEVCAIIDQIIECMNYAVEQYNQCDEDVKSTINALRI